MDPLIIWHCDIHTGWRSGWKLESTWLRPDSDDDIVLTLTHWTPALPSCCGSLACLCYRPARWRYFSFTWNSKKGGEREGARERKWLCVCCLHVWVIFYTHRHRNCSDMPAWRPYDCLQIDQSPSVSVNLNSLIPAILDIWGRPLHPWETLIDIFQHFLVIYGRNYWPINPHRPRQPPAAINSSCSHAESLSGVTPVLSEYSGAP